MTTKKISLKSVEVINAYHAQSIVQAAVKFESKISIEVPPRRANAKSIIGLLSIQIKLGDTFLITAEGPDEKEAVAAIISVVNNLK